MGLHLVELYRSPNIGIFLKANDKFVLAPKGIAESKAEKFARDLGVQVCKISVGGTRLLGPLIAMNNSGAVVSRMIEDYEQEEIASLTGLKVSKMNSKYTAVGNLVAANDSGALVSPVLEQHAIKQVEATLGVSASTMLVDEFYQVGALAVATNSGAAIYPKVGQKEAEDIGRILRVEASPSSVNGGIPFVSSGVVANSKNALVGNLTTGPELVFLTRALKV